MRYTLRDPTLLHQVIIISSGNNIVVSCNCRAPFRTGRYEVHPAYVPIGITHNTDDTKRLYNDPKNHYAPFSPEWELKYPFSKEYKGDRDDE